MTARFSPPLVTVTAIAGLMALGAAPAAATPLYNECADAAYAAQLKVDLDTGAFSGDRAAAASRVQRYAAHASPYVSADARALVEAELAVLGGASPDVFSDDRVIQAWGDVVDWHTVHCS